MSSQSRGKNKKTSTSVIERPGINWRENSKEHSSDSLFLSARVVKEAASHAPIATLKQAANSALLILKATQIVKRNKEAYKRLGLDSAGLIIAIWRSFKKAEDPEKWLSAEIQDILEDVSHTLENISSFVNEQISKKKAIRVFISRVESVKINVKINEYREHLNYAMQKFELQSHMNINDVLKRVLKKNDELSEQMLYRNEEEDEVKHTLKIKARDREMAGIPHKLANFLPPPPSPTQMVSSSPSINHGPPFDIPGCLPENDGPPLSALAESKSFPLIYPFHCEAGVPKTIWESILAWVEYKQKKERERAIEERARQVTRREETRELEKRVGVSHASMKERLRQEMFRKERKSSRQVMPRETSGQISESLLYISSHVKGIELGTEEKKERKQTLEMILLWIRSCGKEALKQAEFDLEKRSVKPTGIIQHIEQLLELMEEECLHQLQRQPHGPGLISGVSRVFKEIREEIPTLSEIRQFILEEPRLEKKLSNALDQILRLSSWTRTHNMRLRELLRNALLTLNNLGGNEEYHYCLRDFMKRRTALCAFMMENANAITAEDSETIAELCRNLRRLAQNLGKIASTKAEQYEKLFQNFIANKEDLSHWLDSASPGQGRSLVDGFTDSLKIMASTMRREANFWNSQSNLFHIWPNIKETYVCDINAMLPFPSEQRELNDHRSSTTPSIPGSVTQNKPEPQRVPQAAQRVSATFADVQKLRVNTTQAFLAKTENSISKRMHETRGYLEFVVDVAEKQLSEPAEGCTPKIIVCLAEKALCIAKQWNKLQRKVKYWGSILSIFSKPLACQTFDMASGISRDDFLGRVIATPDTLIHPYVIEFELCLRDMWHHFLSRKHFWAGIDSDPATFPLEYALAHDPITPHSPPRHILSTSHLIYIILSILILSILSILICF